MKNLVCFLEEPSAREMLNGILSRILSDNIPVKYVVFEGKQDLDAQLLKRLNGWQTPDTVFLILRDKDSGDCLNIKRKLIEIVDAARKRDVSVIRIACQELESFYLGDLEAVERALEISGLAQKQRKQKYRNPDKLANPSQELYKLTNNEYQKVAGSRVIAKHLKIDGTNKSYSFNILLDGIKKLVEV